jgi:hypothetical protein
MGGSVTTWRLALTAAAMAGIGVVLDRLAPGVPATLAALRDPQQVTDTSGAGTLVVAVVGGLARLIWAWGCLGLLLTAVGAVPGLVGWAARRLLQLVLPAGARRAAALALGVGVALNAPLLAGTAFAAPIPDWPTSAAATTGAPAPAVPDWPASGPTAASTAGPAADHVVVRGDCLWDIAADHVRATSGRPPGNAEIAQAVRAWSSANAAVIGPDPDLILPGQVLRAPDAP